MSGADRNGYTLCVKDTSDDNGNVACSAVFAESASYIPQMVDRSPSISSSSSSPMSTDSDDGGYFAFDLSCIVLNGVLGKGGFGTVHRGTLGECQVAVKTFHANSKNPDACQETYERELHVLRLGLCHDNLVRMLGATCIEGWQRGARIVMDYAGNCSLQTILDDEDTKLDMDDMVMFGVQMVRGLQYLHQHDILHLDLKPANFMFGSDCVLRLGDFGTCHVLGTPFESQLMGTLAFRAPELFNKGDPTQAADVFSLGETQKMPYEGMPPMAIVYQVVRTGVRPQVPAAIILPFPEPVEYGL
nr:hypothetical protein BaRGS_010092 [Batillaria attramentaria]